MGWILETGDREADRQDLRLSVKRPGQPTAYSHYTPSSPQLAPPSGQAQERVLLMWSTQVRFQSRQHGEEGWRLNLE